MKRRHFLFSSAALASGVHPFGQTAFAQVGGNYRFNDYRAMVVVLLGGGNDAYNMLVPIGDETGTAQIGTGYGGYKQARQKLSVSNNAIDLDSYRRDGRLDFESMGNTYTGSGKGAEQMYLNGHIPLAPKNGVAGANIGLGFNSVMPELADLYSDGSLAVVSNAGTLIEPVSRSTIDNGSAILPNFLFAHDHQTKFMSSASASATSRTGWGGRIADSFNLPYKPMPVGVSLAGTSGLLTGASNTPLALGKDLNLEFNAANGSADPGHIMRREMLMSMSGQSANSVYGNRIRSKQAKHYEDVLTLNAAFRRAPSFDGAKDPYGNNLFSSPNTAQTELPSPFVSSLMAQLEATAKAIAVAAENPESANRRQVYFVTMPDFDTHSGQAERHLRLLRGLSLSLWHFQKGLEHLGLQNQVTTSVLSEMGRSLTTNFDGTDHGWAGHELVMGGAVNGGQRIGDLADLRVGGAGDHSSKGRIIPTTSLDQVHASVASWMGLKDEDLGAVFPLLANFQNSAGNASSALLQGLMQV